MSGLIREGNAVRGVEGVLEGRPVLRRGRLVIGADGRGSAVARRMGSVRFDRSLDKIALVGYLSGVERADAVGEVFLGKRRYAILNPIAPGETNLGVVIDRRDWKGAPTPQDLIEEALAANGALRERLSRARVLAPPRALGPLAHRASRFAVPGAVLVGDAAGFLDPFTGEGIFAALRSAQLASEAASRALESAGDEAPNLSGYAAAWEKELKRKWRLSRLIQEAVKRPWLAEWLAGRLATRPRLMSRLMAAFGDLKMGGSSPTELDIDSLRPVSEV